MTRYTALANKETRIEWICQKCSMIYDPVTGDPDSGIAPGTPFAEIPEDWTCPIWGAQKQTFALYEAPAVA
jgi:rubredoxin